MKRKYLLSGLIFPVLILTLFAFTATGLCEEQSGPSAKVEASGKTVTAPSKHRRGDDFTLGSVRLVGHQWIMGHIRVLDDAVEIKKTRDGLVTSIPRGYVIRIKRKLRVW